MKSEAFGDRWLWPQSPHPQGRRSRTRATSTVVPCPNHVPACGPTVTPESVLPSSINHRQFYYQGINIRKKKAWKREDWDTDSCCNRLSVQHHQTNKIIIIIIIAHNSQGERGKKGKLLQQIAGFRFLPTIPRTAAVGGIERTSPTPERILSPIVVFTSGTGLAPSPTPVPSSLIACPLVVLAVAAAAFLICSWVPPPASRGG